MSDDREKLMHDIMDLLDAAHQRGATPYDLVSTLAAVTCNLLGGLKPDNREEAAAFFTSRLSLGVNFEEFIESRERRRKQ
jgi:hypothetical protein